MVEKTISSKLFRCIHSHCSFFRILFFLFYTAHFRYKNQRWKMNSMKWNAMIELKTNENEIPFGSLRLCMYCTIFIRTARVNQFLIRLLIETLKSLNKYFTFFVHWLIRSFAINIIIIIIHILIIVIQNQMYSTWIVIRFPDSFRTKNKNRKFNK